MQEAYDRGWTDYSFDPIVTRLKELQSVLLANHKAKTQEPFRGVPNQGAGAATLPSVWWCQINFH